jgi:hypothetical protein
VPKDEEKGTITEEGGFLFQADWFNFVLVGVGVVRPVLPLLASRGGEGEGQDGEWYGAVSLPPTGRGGKGRRKHSLARSATLATQVFGRPQDFEFVLHSCSLTRLGDGLDARFGVLLDWKSDRRPFWMREEEVLRTSQADRALSRRIYTKAKFVAVIFGHQRPPRAVMCSWHHGIQFL